MSMLKKLIEFLWTSNVSLPKGEIKVSPEIQFAIDHKIPRVGNKFVISPSNILFKSNVLKNTICYAPWVNANANAIIESIPQDWIHLSQVQGWLPTMWQFKLIGLDWRSDEEFCNILAVLTTLQLVEQKHFVLRRGEHKFNFETGETLTVKT